jgi:hypothetical protein
VLISVVIHRTTPASSRRRDRRLPMLHVDRRNSVGAEI